MSLSPDMQTLYTRAIENPFTLSPAEKYFVLRGVSKEEDDKSCLRRCGLTRREALDKALATPNDLTQEEVDCILAGTEHDPDMAELTDEHAELQLNARVKVEHMGDETKDYDDWLAVIVAHWRSTQLRNERLFNEENEMWDLLRARAEAAPELSRPAWIQEVIDAEPKRWGFVCFATGHAVKPPGAEEWDQKEADLAAIGRFADIIDTFTYKGLRYQWAGLDEGKLSETYEMMFPMAQTFPDTSFPTMRLGFRMMRDMGMVPEGLRTDCFLVVDLAEVPDGLAADDLYIMQFVGTSSMDVTAVYADYDEDSAEIEGGFMGHITVPLPRVYDWLHYSLFAEKETWEERHKMTTTQSWTKDIWENERPPQFPRY
ncbi:hypothetical protein CkaCkLH20_02286 [Colletotrichum karsti]|uniref:Uncharacterized protein n=1 Tax=Colletotrichum karsti TaxID=1095194 RepID=A0A9P6IBG5_9PEZI|nr:uncharacterized protein CkaCkLH20_02286 [Colletotrichum karsti]KAF9880332.1 hypothetical protein CkaCkLH20_02286 [Colletotrichum karsti]